MKYFWVTLFGSFIIASVYFAIMLRTTFKKYASKKKEESPNFKEEKYQGLLGDYFHINPIFINEIDFDKDLIKLKDRYNLWVKKWWYLVAVIIIIILFGFILNYVLINYN